MFKVEFPQIKVDLDQFSDAKIQKFCQTQAQDTVALIRRDTQAGKTADGGNLKPYARSTLEQKAKRGESTTPNLTHTGEMLGAVQTRPITRGAEIFFNGSHKGGLSNAALAVYLMAKGFIGWFTLDKTRDADRIDRNAAKFVDDAAKKLIVTK